MRAVCGISTGLTGRIRIPSLMTQSRYGSLLRSDMLTGRSRPTCSSSSFWMRIWTWRVTGNTHRAHIVKDICKHHCSTNYLSYFKLERKCFYLWVVQQVGQDPQQCGGCRLNPSSKSLCCCHEDMVICYPLVFWLIGLLKMLAVHLAHKQGVQKVAGLTFTQGDLDKPEVCLTSSGA